MGCKPEGAWGAEGSMGRKADPGRKGVWGGREQGAEGPGSKGRRGVRGGREYGVEGGLGWRGLGVWKI
jgi:hypothetical protein